MKKIKRQYIVNLVGWILIIFLTISKFYFSEQLSVVTTGFGGLICIIIGAYLIFYKPKENHVIE